MQLRITKGFYGLLIGGLLLAAGITGGYLAYNVRQQLRDEIREVRMEASRASASAAINVEYDLVLQSLLAKLSEYGTLDNFSEREITGLARLIMEQSAIHREDGLTSSLMLALIEVESGFNPDAVSSAGAIGLAQVMPGTSRAYLQRLGYSEYSDRLLTDPLINTRVGVEHLLFLHRMLVSEGLEDPDDFDLSLVAYNWGEGPLRRLLAGLDDPADLSYAVKVRNRVQGYIERGVN